MQNSNLILLILLFPFFLHSQHADAQKSSWSLQAGMMGLYFNNEIRFSEKLALRNETGIEMTSRTLLCNKDIPFVITTEPRFYFSGLNADKSWLLSLKTSYHPQYLLISRGTYKSDVSIVPTIAERYKLGKHFTYEWGVGIGYRYIFKSTNDPACPNSSYSNEQEQSTRYGSVLAFNCVLRIGYTL